MPNHGPLPCTLCWVDGAEAVQNCGSFRLVRDPGHWGSASPAVLVLGMSKGNTQARAFGAEPFDAVAFKGMRHRLLSVLQAVGLLTRETSQDFEKRFTPEEGDLAFASMVRCSLTGLDVKSGRFSAESTKVVPAFHPGNAVYSAVLRCTEEYVGKLCPETRLVIMLGNADAYMKAVAALVEQATGAFSRVNPVAFNADDVRFVHVAHPSRGNGHFGAFVRGDGEAGLKKRAASHAINALGVVV